MERKVLNALAILAIAEAEPTDPQGYAIVARSLAPFLELLLGSPDQTVQVSLVLGPTLAAALLTPHWQAGYQQWCHDAAAVATDAATAFSLADREHAAYLATYEATLLHHAATLVPRLPDGSIIGALAACCAAGSLELLATTATPLNAAQLDAASARVETLANQRPRGVWLPHHRLTPTDLFVLEASKLRYCVLDSDPKAITDAPPAPFRLGGSHMRGLLIHPHLATLSTSVALGYPGDPLFAAERCEPIMDLRLWSRAGDHTLYDPYPAVRRATEHATHFIATTDALFTHHPGALVALVDLQHMATTWYEGPLWLRAVLTLPPPARSFRFLTTRAIVQSVLPLGTQVPIIAL